MLLARAPARRTGSPQIRLVMEETIPGCPVPTVESSRQLKLHKESPRSAAWRIFRKVNGADCGPPL